MVVTCWMPNCCHNNFSYTCKFFKFPKSTLMRNKWLKLMKRNTRPKACSLVCSCHFPGGKKEYGPQILLNNIKIQDIFSVQPSTQLDVQMDLVPETSAEIHETEDISSPQSSTYQGFEMVLFKEKSTEFYENENDSIAQLATNQNFEIVFKTEKPTEFAEIEDNSNSNQISTPESFHMDLAAETSAEIYEIEDDSNSSQFSMDSVTNTPVGFHEIEDYSNSAQTSISQCFQKKFVTKTSTEIHKIEANQTSNKSLSTPDESISTSFKNNSKPQFNSVALLEAENYFLKKKIEELKKMHRVPFNFDLISKNEKYFSYYTGLPNVHVFNALYELTVKIPIKYSHGWKVEILSKKDQLFLTLMRIRHNFRQGDLAFRFNVSECSITNIIFTWIHVLHHVLLKQLANTPGIHDNKTRFILFIDCKFNSNCAELCVQTTKKSLPVQNQNFDPLNIKILTKLWSELHNLAKVDKRRLAKQIMM